MEYKVYECNGYRLHTVKTDKFRNVLVDVLFRDRLSKNKITSMRVLSNMMVYDTYKYNSKRSFAIELENLYNMQVSSSYYKMGKEGIMEFTFDFLNPKYAHDTYMEEVVDFIKSLLLEPNIKDGKFSSKEFKVVLNRIKTSIEAIRENSFKSGLRSVLSNFDSETGYDMYGTLDDLANISLESLCNTYKEMISSNKVDVYVVGNIDMEKFASLFRSLFVISNEANFRDEFYVSNGLRGSVLDILEKGNYKQDGLFMVYNLDGLSNREKDSVLAVFNSIFGSGSMDNKLFKHLREENSLCYQVASSYLPYDGLLLVYAGIDASSKSKCVELVKGSLREVINGDFSKEELDSAKEGIRSELMIADDNIYRLLNDYILHDFILRPFKDERLSNYMSVSKEEIVALAKKIKLNVVYLLEGSDK